MSTIKISVIVTIHNAEQYVRECLDSVLSQSFSAIEVLCMDGGSKDSTPKILEEYAKKDERIRIINDSNCSYGHKVNRGIEEAKGKYVAVLESDDMYEICMLEKLYEIAENYKVDYVNADYTNFFDVNGVRFSYVQKMYQREEYDHIIERSRLEIIDLFPRYWTGLFNKEFLNTNCIHMNESSGASFQDMSFRFLTSMLASRVYHLSCPVYRYRIDNFASSMHDCRKTIVIAEEHKFLQNEIKRRKISERNVWFSAFQWKYMDFRGNMRNLWGKYRLELFERYRVELLKDMTQLNSMRDIGFQENVVEMIDMEPEKLHNIIEVEARDIENYWEEMKAVLIRATDVPRKNGIVIFGSGRCATRVLELLEPLRDKIWCITDNNSKLWNTEKMNYLIQSPEACIKNHKEALYIIAVKQAKDQIEEQLKESNIKNMCVMNF